MSKPRTTTAWWFVSKLHFQHRRRLTNKQSSRSKRGREHRLGSYCSWQSHVQCLRALLHERPASWSRQFNSFGWFSRPTLLLAAVFRKRGVHGWCYIRTWYVLLIAVDQSWNNSTDGSLFCVACGKFEILKVPNHITCMCISMYQVWSTSNSPLPAQALEDDAAMKWPLKRRRQRKQTFGWLCTSWPTAGERVVVVRQAREGGVAQLSTNFPREGGTKTRRSHKAREKKETAY